MVEARRLVAAEAAAGAPDALAPVTNIVYMGMGTDELRDWLVPVNRRRAPVRARAGYPLGALLGALRELFPRGRGRFVLFEYVMLAGVNDTDADAARLAALAADIEAKFNLITFNPHAGTRFAPSPPERVLRFRSTLIQAGRVCTVRDSRGDDEMAACGQLGDVGALGARAPVLHAPLRFQKALLAPV